MRDNTLTRLAVSANRIRLATSVSQYQLSRLIVLGSSSSSHRPRLIVLAQLSLNDLQQPHLLLLLHTLI
jgi:hypothetical protein